MDFTWNGYEFLHGEDDDLAGRAAPHVPAVAPLPSALARASALAALRPITSTALPPLTARAPMALAMFPEPMMRPRTG